MLGIFGSAAERSDCCREIGAATGDDGIGNFICEFAAIEDLGSLNFAAMRGASSSIKRGWRSTGLAFAVSMGASTAAPLAICIMTFGKGNSVLIRILGALA